MSKYYDEKAKERTNRYRAEKRDKLTLDLPKGAKERYRQHVAEHYPPGTSLTAVIVQLLEKDIQNS